MRFYPSYLNSYAGRYEVEIGRLSLAIANHNVELGPMDAGYSLSGQHKGGARHTALRG